MQCTSFIPVYYQPRSVNGAASGFPWHLLNGNANYGDQRGFNSSLQPSSAYQYSSYDKDAVRQIIQNHEATFRYQVQELHRLYKQQRELMDEMRMREIVVQHMQTSESIQCLSQPLSDISQTSHTPSGLLGDHSHSKLLDLAVNTILPSPSFVTDGITGQIKNGCDEVDFLSPSKEHGKKSLDLVLPADVSGTNATAYKLIDLQPMSDSEIGSGKTSERMSCLINLNEPIQLESMSSNSTCAFATHKSHMEIMCKDCPHGTEQAEPESGRNSPMAIDLNSMPIDCISETEATLENAVRITEETAVILDKMLETETLIDLNTGDVNEHLRAVGGSESMGSLCPENEECSFEQRSENVRPQTSLLSKKQEEKVKPPLELNAAVAAQTLLVFSSLTENPQVLGNSGNCLYWFADIVSSAGDRLENDITDDFRTTKMKVSEENAVGKRKETDAFSTEEFLKTRRQRRNASKKVCPKSRKCSKIDMVKKCSVLKQPATRNRHGILQSWGRMRKRQEGHRRRTSKFPAIK